MNLLDFNHTNFNLIKFVDTTMATAQAQAGQGSKKRQQLIDSGLSPDLQSKKSRPQNTPQNVTLTGPHEAIISELHPKYNILPASVISSTQIRKRVIYVTKHLSPDDQSRHLALLYARPADVCKLITVVEQCKRVLKEEGRACYQYNQLFELPLEEKKPDVVNETVLGGVEEGESSDDDAFEVMESRFEKAVLPPASSRGAKSIRVFLSSTPVPELKAKGDVTLQSSEARF